MPDTLFWIWKIDDESGRILPCCINALMLRLPTMVASALHNSQCSYGYLDA